MISASTAYEHFSPVLIWSRLSGVAGEQGGRWEFPFGDPPLAGRAGLLWGPPHPGLAGITGSFLRTFNGSIARSDLRREIIFTRPSAHGM